MTSHLDKIRFRHLLLVEALAETKSLRKAAHTLGLTQPGCSKLLRELERELGVMLFNRTAGGVSPTPYGEILIRNAHLMLTHANATFDEFDAVANGTRIRVRIGMYGVALSTFVADVVESLRAGTPGILVSIEEGTADTLLPALARGDIDCVIGRGRQAVAAEGCTQIPLFFEQVVVVGRRGHPLARRKRVGVEEAVAHEWMLPSEKTMLRSRLEEVLAKRRLPLPACSVESSAHLINQIMLPRGNLLCLFPETLAGKLAAAGDLAVIPVDLGLDLPAVTLWVWGHAPYIPAVEKFIQAANRMAERQISGRSGA